MFGGSFPNLPNPRIGILLFSYLVCLFFFKGKTQLMPMHTFRMVEMLSGNVNSNLVIGAARSPTGLSPPVTTDGLMLPPALPEKRTPSPTSQAALNKKAVETSL